MIDRKYFPQVFSFFMALVMSSIMSLVISLFNVGPTAQILLIWLKAWLLAFCIAFPTIMVITPLVRQLATGVVRKEYSNPEMKL